MNVDDLKPDPRNPRRISPEAMGALSRSLEAFGDIAGLTFNQRTGHLVSGHQRLAALRAEHGDALRLEDGAVVTPDGQRFPVRVVDWDEITEKAANLAANSPYLAGEFTEGLLPLLEEIRAELPDLCGALRLDDLRDFLPEITWAPIPEAVDEVPAAPSQAFSRPGDLWLLGEHGHRVLCGDARKPQDVALAVGGRTVALLWTDPPYGVDYVGKTKDALKIAHDDPEGLPLLLSTAFRTLDAVMAPGTPFYIAHPAGPLSVAFGQAILEMGWRLHQTLVWVKDSMVLGHSDYHYRHEPVLYGWKVGAEHPWRGDRAQTSVFEVARPKASPDHPTAKPVKLIAAMLANSSRAGELVLDPFLGSGTTLMACEEMGRCCAGLELEPRYVDVAVMRWHKAAGKEPLLVREGREVPWGEVVAAGFGTLGGDLVTPASSKIGVDVLRETSVHVSPGEAEGG